MQPAVQPGPRNLLKLTREYAFPITEQGIRIGSHPNNGIVLTSSFVAAAHALVWEYGGRCYVRDLGSGGLTAVNGQPITGTVEIRPGDGLAIGDHVLRFWSPDPVPVASPVAQPNRADVTGTVAENWGLAVLAGAITFVALLLIFVAMRSIL